MSSDKFQVKQQEQEQREVDPDEMGRHQQEQDGPQSTEAASAVDPNVVYSASGGHASRTSSQQQQQIFRIKGIVSIVSSEDYELEAVDEKAIASGLDPRRFIVQAVHDLWDIQPVTSLDLFWESEESRSGKIVVIGKFLDEKRLRDGFQKCFVWCMSSSDNYFYHLLLQVLQNAKNSSKNMQEEQFHQNNRSKENKPTE